MSDPVLARTFAAGAGPRVRLALARPADRERVKRLLRVRTVPARDLDVRRLLAFDPADRLVLCAFAPLDGVETLVGLAAIDLAPGAEVDTLVVDERLTSGLGELLIQVVTDRARGRQVA